MPTGLRNPSLQQQQQQQQQQQPQQPQQQQQQPQQQQPAAQFEPADTWRKGVDAARTGLRSARRNSFTKHERLSVPILPFKDLNETRASLMLRLTQPLERSNTKCVQLPPRQDCASNFVGWQKGLLPALLASHALQAHPITPVAPPAAQPAAMPTSSECDDQLQLKTPERWVAASAEIGHQTFELDASDQCEWLRSSTSTLNANECLVLPEISAYYGQEAAWCLEQRDSEENHISALFALGPHVAYGAVFDAAFRLLDEQVPTWRGDEIRISVHLDFLNARGHSVRQTMGAIEKEVRRLLVDQPRKCTVLAVSSRRQQLAPSEVIEAQLIEQIAEKVGCRLLLPPARKAQVLGDLFFLAHGHVLVGTFGSAHTTIIQQLIAARSTGYPVLPTVTLCEVWQHKCLKPLPLLTNKHNNWYISLPYNGEIRIRAPGFSLDVDEWAPYPSPVTVDVPKAYERKKEVLKGGAKAHEWPSSDEAIRVLQKFKWPAEAPPQNAYLAAIISGNVLSARYHAVFTSVTSCGFTAQHVPAVTPADYDSSEAMINDLFGAPDRRPRRMSPFELGLVLSHRRALSLIARGPYKWGAVFEDDAYLHEAVPPWQAAHVLHQTFEAAGSRSGTFVYLGACNPECRIYVTIGNHSTHVGRLPFTLARGGFCRGYCTHAYAVSQPHAATLFDDVFNCRNGTEHCGVECLSHPCYMDWAFFRHFTRGNAAWLVGAGLASQFAAEHRGMFGQNRSGQLANRGTTLSRTYKFLKEVLADAEERRATIEDRAACSALLKNATVLNTSRIFRDPASQPALQKVFVTMRWTGRTGNLLFEAAALLGTMSTLNALAPTESFSLRLPAKVQVPAKELFERYPRFAKLVPVLEGLPWVRPGELEHLGTSTRLRDQLRDLLDYFFPRADTSTVSRCLPCMLTVADERSNAFSESMISSLKAWVRRPPEGCTVGIVEMMGYFQSFKYSRSIATTILQHSFGPEPATQQAADDLLRRARHDLSADFLIGVQVRLGDKLDKEYAGLYANTSWEYYRSAMSYLAKNLTGGGRRPAMPGPRVGFVITAGGSMGNNSDDMALARQHFDSMAQNLFFSPSADPHVDLAILRGCDALVIGPSTLGWWAAFLARLPRGRVIAPTHIINPELPWWHSLKRGFEFRDYYPPDWFTIENDGSGEAKAVNWRDSEAYQAQQRLMQLQTSGIQLAANETMGSSKVLNDAFKRARQARERALRKRGLIP